jgi:hypothetical protein
MQRMAAVCLLEYSASGAIAPSVAANTSAAVSAVLVMLGSPNLVK